MTPLQLLVKVQPARKNERGIAGFEGLAFGVLIFVFGTLIVSTAWGAIDARLATDSAAREAARVFVESNTRSDAYEKAEQSARDVMAGYNRNLDGFEINVDSFQRCRPVAVTARTDVQRISLPLVGRSSGSYKVVAHHSEIVDPYRSGLAGSAHC